MDLYGSSLYALNVIHVHTYSPNDEKKPAVLKKFPGYRSKGTALSIYIIILINDFDIMSRSCNGNNISIRQEQFLPAAGKLKAGRRD